MPFLTKLVVSPIRGTNQRRILSPLVYEDRLWGKIVVPEGFISNYASIPEWIPRFILDEDSPEIRDISVVHDFLYSTVCRLDITRQEADEVLYRGMRELKASYIISRIAYWSVRIAGESHWRND